MEGFGQLDKWTIDRIENILGTDTTIRLKQAIIQVVNELYDDGYPSEDIYDYVRGILVEQLEEE